MALSNKPLDRLLCAESLEGRWLLSGVGPPWSVGYYAAGGGAVAVLEFGPADNEPDEDVEIAASELPAKVLAAFMAQFPDAEISDAQREIEDGQIEFDVNAEVDGREIDVSMTPDGQILEVEETVA